MKQKTKTKTKAKKQKPILLEGTITLGLCDQTIRLIITTSNGVPEYGVMFDEDPKVTVFGFKTKKLRNQAILTTITELMLSPPQTKT